MEKEELRNCVIEYSTKTTFGGKNYNKFVEKFVFICRKLNNIICCTSLGEYGLPTRKWFLTHCPDKSVKGYYDFCKWCGLEDILNKTKKEYLTKEKVIKIIYNMQSKINRPLMYDDFRCPKEDEVGITTIKRYWGTMNKMKKDLGLQVVQEDMICKHIDDVNLIIEGIKKTCDKIYEKENRKTVMTKDIEKYSELNVGCGAIRKVLSLANKTLREVVAEYGFVLQNEGNGLVYHFADGETTKSSYELMFTNKLREYGYKYNIDYQRDVRYRTFINYYDGLLDCDYVIKNVNGENVYIELAGMLKSYENKYNTVEEIKSNSKRKYAIKLHEKEEMLKEYELKYYILFPLELEENKMDELFDRIGIKRLNSKEGEEHGKENE